MEILNSVRFRYFFHEIPRFRFGFGIYGVFKKTVKKREKKFKKKLNVYFLVIPGFQIEFIKLLTFLLFVFVYIV